MKQDLELEKLISAGFRIEFGDYAAAEEWLYKVYVALAPFPAQKHKLKLAYSDSNAVPAEKIRLGLELLSEALDECSERFHSGQHGVSMASNEKPDFYGQVQL